MMIIMAIMIKCTKQSLVELVKFIENKKQI